MTATRGRHSAGDGSFGRSAGAAAGRGALLLAVAVVLGIILLQAADDAPPGQEVTAGRNSGGGPTTTTTEEAVTTTLPLRPPPQVKVLVVNGAGVPRAAANTNSRLEPLGYNLLAPTDGVATEVSSVFFSDGFEREAAEVAQSLELPADAVKPMSDPPPVANLREANVVVHVGPELAQRITSG